jgi:hypothetical protein
VSAGWIDIGGQSMLLLMMMTMTTMLDVVVVVAEVITMRTLLCARVFPGTTCWYLSDSLHRVVCIEMRSPNRSWFERASPTRGWRWHVCARQKPVLRSMMPSSSIKIVCAEAIASCMCIAYLRPLCIPLVLMCSVC